MKKQSLQELIARPDRGKEREQSIELKVRVSTYGKRSQLYKVILSMIRRCKVSLGDRITFHREDGTQLVDDLSDDKGEHWHSLDWTKEDAEDEGLHSDKSRESHPAERRKG